MKPQTTGRLPQAWRLNQIWEDFPRKTQQSTKISVVVPELEPAESYLYESDNSENSESDSDSPESEDEEIENIPRQIGSDLEEDKNIDFGMTEDKE